MILNDDQQYRTLQGLKSKVAVITGGAQGIGRVISLTMAKLGAKVAIIDNSEVYGKETVEEINNLNIEALFFKGDVCNVRNIENCISNIMEKWRKLHILINNAGITNSISFDDLTLEDWEKVIDRKSNV